MQSGRGGGGLTDIGGISKAFVDVIEHLIKDNGSGLKIFVESKDGEYINFRSSTFKLALARRIGGEKEVGQYLKAYKIWGFIVTDNDRDRFTNIQRINNKPMRVITVKRSIFELLKHIGKEDRKK